MAIKKEIAFQLLFRGDGTSTSFTADVTTAPFQYQFSGNIPPPGFPVGTALPTAVVDPSCPGFTVTASVSAGIVTFTFNNPPGANTDYFVSGKLQF